MKRTKRLALFTGLVCIFTTTLLSACSFFQNSTENSSGSGEEKTYVRYGEFGAVGDGKTDDFEAIVQTHKYANENGLSVKADDDASYYVGAHTATAVIRTDTDWGNAEFIIDDREVSVDDRSWYVFEVSPDSSSYKVQTPSGYSLKAGQKNIGLTFEEDVMLYIVNGNKKDYIRYGKNENDGSFRQEIILTDKNGNVDEDTPILWDYDTVTAVTAYPVSDKAITVEGGSFTTIANTAPVSSSYYTRGINVKRSNTTLFGIKHYITGEGAQSSPYTGFYVVNYANHVTIESCVLTGHTTYTNIKPTGAVSQGTYDTQAVRSNDITWLDCTQSNDVTDTTYWGIMASNFCKNLKMRGCNLSRFDAHQGVYNATITDTVLGQNLSIVGAGALYLENVHRLSGSRFIQLRTDYGSTWEGDITLKDCTLTTNSNPCYILEAVWNDWDFGYPCYLPQSVTLDNFKVEGGISCYIFSKITDSSAQTIQTSKNPYGITEKIFILNENSALNVSNNTSGLFNNVAVIRE